VSIFEHIYNPHMQQESPVSFMPKPHSEALL
jgi:hypothetical protein